MKEGSILDPKQTYDINSECTILNISNEYAFEDSKIIYSLEHLDVIIAELKRKNSKIVLTSGCYDILHVGHIHNLRESKKLGDVLIACLSCDEQIKKLKGDSRPINKYIDRINLFKIISYIDYIVLYPYCWAKGSDYTIDKIMEKHPYLNKVILIDNIKDKSTTNIINSIIHN